MMSSPCRASKSTCLSAITADSAGPKDLSTPWMRTAVTIFVAVLMLAAEDGGRIDTGDFDHADEG